jgi:hypothetical protein
MAVRTGHKTFIDPMLGRECKLGSHVVVASVADICLALTKQTTVRLRLVNRVARGTNDIGLRVIAAPDVRPVLVFRMASQTGIQSLTGCHLGKGDDRVLSAFRFHMLLTGAVTTLTSGLVDRRVGQDTGFIVRIPKKLERHIRMTCTAGVAAGISVAGSG